MLKFLGMEKEEFKCNLCSGLISGEHCSPKGCAHLFHIPCLENWSFSNNTDDFTCPVSECSLKFTEILSRKSLNDDSPEILSLKDTLSCPICCEILRPPIATPESCNHTFCHDCLMEWSRVRHECPLDRGRFELILLFDKIGGSVVKRVFPPAVEPEADEQFDNDTVCEICFNDEDDAHLLLCDRCDRGYHTYCLPVPLSSIPLGDWFCPRCENRRSMSSSRRRGRGYESADLEDDSNLVDLEAVESDRLDTDSESSSSSDSDFTLGHRISNSQQRRLFTRATQNYRGSRLLADTIRELARRTLQSAARERQSRRERVRTQLASDLASGVVRNASAANDTNSRRRPRLGSAVRSSRSNTNADGARMRTRQRTLDFTSRIPSGRVVENLLRDAQLVMGGSPDSAFAESPLRSPPAPVVRSRTSSASSSPQPLVIKRRRVNALDDTLGSIGRSDEQPGPSTRVDTPASRSSAPSTSRKSPRKPRRLRKRKTRRSGLRKRRRTRRSVRRPRLSTTQKRLQSRMKQIRLRGSLNSSTSSSRGSTHRRIINNDRALVSDSFEEETNERLPNHVAKNTRSTTRVLSNSDDSPSPIPGPSTLSASKSKNKTASATHVVPNTNHAINGTCSSADHQSSSAESEPSSSAPKNGWTPAQINRVQSLVKARLESHIQSGKIDRAVYKHIMTRALFKVQQKQPSKVSDNRVLNLLEEYVNYIKRHNLNG